MNTEQPENPKKTEWVGIAAILGLALTAFLAMVIALLRTPEVAAPQEPDFSVEVEAGRSPEALRAYNRSLTVHDVSGRTEPEKQAESAGDHEHLVPDAPEADWSDGSFNRQRIIKTPLPVIRGGLDPGEEEDEQAGKGKSGWGWLADDVLSGRKKSSGPDAGKKDDRKDDVSEEGDRNSEGPDDGNPNTEEREDRDLLARPSMMNMDLGRDPAIRSMHEQERTGDEERSREDGVTRADGREGEAAPVTEEEDARQADRQERETAFGARDPFAPADESQRPAFGSSAWQFGDPESSVFRPREDAVSRAAAGAAASAQQISSAQADEFYGRVVGDAASDASRLSSGWSGYASDSIFSGGGGYTPAGVNAGGSESLFSGAGVFGGGVGSSLVTPINSSAGGIAPLGGSSAAGLPAAGSTLRSGSFEDDRTTPSALPW